MQSVLPLSYYTNLFKNNMLNSLISVFVNNVNKGGNCSYDSTKSLLFITFIKWKMSIQQNAKMETWF